MSLLKSSILISTLTLVSSIVSFANQVLIASAFGTGHHMDTYLFLTSFPFLLSGVISSAFSFSLIPNFVTNTFNYFLKFLKTIIYFSLGLFLFFLLVYHFFLIDYFGLENFPHIKLLNLLVWLVFLATIVFNVISCYFTSKSRFIIPVILNFFPFIFSIICILLMHDWGVCSIVLGLFAGYIFAISFSAYYFIRNEKYNDENNDYKKEILLFLKSMRFSIISMLTFSVFQIVDAFWGKRLGESAISYLGYSQRIIIAVGALVITGPSSVLIPRLTTAYSNGNFKEYYQDSATVIKLVFSLTSFAAAIGSFFSYDIVQIMFQRGNFTEQSTQNVADILPYMLLGMTFMLSVVISFRSIFVQNISLKTSLIGVFTFVLYFLLSGLLSHYFSLKGIAISYIITWILIFFCTLYILFNDRFIYFIKDFLFFLLKQASLLAIVFVVEYILYKLSEYIVMGSSYEGIIFSVFRISVIGGICFLIYAFLGIKILKQKELIILFSKIPILNKWIT